MRIVLFEALIEVHVRDSLARALRELGHEVFAPKAVWHGSTFPDSPESRIRCAVAMEAALAWEPDVFFNFRPSSVTREDLAELRARHITSLVWLSDDPVLYQSTYRETVDAYDLVLNCGESHILDFYAHKHGIIGVNFPFWTDSIACPRSTQAKQYDVAFLGNCFGDVRSNRYDTISNLPGDVRIFGQVDADPRGLAAGYEKDHAALMRKLGGARLGFNIPQRFVDYRHNALNFPELARLGSFQTPSRVVQYAALGLPILTCGLAAPPEWFPEMLAGRDAAACAAIAADLLQDEARQIQLSDAVNQRFRQSYSASRRAAFLDWLLQHPSKWQKLNSFDRSRLYDRFDDVTTVSAAPARQTLEDLRRDAAALDLRAEQPLKILAFGATLNGPTDIVACHIRALRALGHAVLHIDPFQRRDLLDNAKIIGGGFGGNMLNAARVAEQATAFGADLVLTLGGGFGFSSESAAQLRALELPLVGVTLSDPDVQDSMLEIARNFDVYFTNSKLAHARYLAAGLAQTYLMPFAIDRSWVTYEVPADDKWSADVICLGHATGRADRNAAMTALAARFGNVRVYGRGWEIGSVGPVSGLDLLKASRGGLIHVNFPRTAKGFTNVKCGVFETIGSGAILLSETFDELGSLFDYGREIIGYSDIADLCDKVEWLLRNPTERDIIRLNAVQRLVNCHLYEHRWQDAWPLIKAAHPAGPSGWRAPTDARRGRVVIAGLNPALAGDASVIAAVCREIRQSHPLAEVVLLSPGKGLDGTEVVRMDQTEAWSKAAAEADVVVLHEEKTSGLVSKGRMSLPRAFAQLAQQNGAVLHEISGVQDMNLLTVKMPVKAARASLGLASAAEETDVIADSPLASTVQEASSAHATALWQASGEFGFVDDPDKLVAATLSLTPTPISLRVSGLPNSKIVLTFRVKTAANEGSNAAVVQIAVADEQGEDDSIYGHYTAQLGRYRYLPRANRAGLSRLEFLLPADGQIRLALRSWRNIDRVLISANVAIET